MQLKEVNKGNLVLMSLRLKATAADGVVACRNVEVCFG